MFLKKKTAVERNIYDIEYRKLWEAALLARKNLFLTVRDVLVKNIAVTVYPEGADKERAIKVAATVKQNVTEKIFEYERALDKVQKYWNENMTNLKECKSWNPDRFPQNAHDLIESEIRRFYS